MKKYVTFYLVYLVCSLVETKDATFIEESIKKKSKLKKKGRFASMNSPYAK